MVLNPASQIWSMSQAFAVKIYNQLYEFLNRSSKYFNKFLILTD
jgi:hypothetical protein